MPRLIAIENGVIVRVAANGDRIPNELISQWTAQYESAAMILDDNIRCVIGDFWDGFRGVPSQETMAAETEAASRAAERVTAIEQLQLIESIAAGSGELRPEDVSAAIRAIARAFLPSIRSISESPVLTP
jgi:hypothetical protein